MPTRILREGILTSEKVNALTFESERFYRRLMSVVDDYGRYFSHPSLIRAACYGLQLDTVSEADVKRMLSECVAAALLLIYNSGKNLLILNFKQQTRSPSKFPEPSEDEMLSNCTSDAKANVKRMCSESESESKTNAKTNAESGVAVVSVGAAAQAPKEAARKNGLPFNELKQELDGFFKRDASKTWSYLDQQAGVRISNTPSWKEEFAIIRAYLNSLPQHKRQYEPGWRGVTRLLEIWGEVLDRSRTIGARAIAKPWMDSDGVPATPTKAELAKLSPEKQKEWWDDVAAWGKT